MPYLRADRKKLLDRSDVLPTTTGDLTYLFTRALLGDPREATLVEALQAAIDRYFARRQINYTLLCDVMGSLTCAGCEYSRRMPAERGHAANATRRETLKALLDFMEQFYTNVVAPYEDTKIEQNGDVYPA